MTEDLENLIEDVIRQNPGKTRYNNEFALVRYEDGTWDAWFGGHSAVAIGEYVDWQASGYSPEEAINNLKDKLNGR